MLHLDGHHNQCLHTYHIVHHSNMDLTSLHEYKKLNTHKTSENFGWCISEI